MILLLIDVPIGTVRQQLEAAVPRRETGSRPDPIGNPVVDDVVEWDFSRSDLQVSSGTGVLRAATTIAGMARIKGNVRLIRGAVGKILGKLNPTNIPFSAHADLRASVTAETRPQLLPNWRVQPNFSATARVDEALIPIAHVGSVSVRGHVQRALDDKLRGLRDQLEAKLRADERIEIEARKAWEKLCRAFPLDSDRDGQPDLYLRVTPVLARATQPRLDERGLSIQVGIEANTEVSEVGSRPDCPFPAVFQILPTDEARFDLTLPVTLPYDTINKLAAAHLPVTIKRPDKGLEATLDSIKLAGTDEGKLLLTAVGRVTESRWLLGRTVEGTFSLRAAPKLDAARQAITFERVEFDVKSRQLFGLTELLAKGAAPMVEQWIMSSLAIDIREEARKILQLAEAATTRLNETADGVAIQAQFDPPSLVGIDFDAQRLRLIAEAHGKVAVYAK